jgi:hypothetical protein
MAVKSKGYSKWKMEKHDYKKIPLIATQSSLGYGTQPPF